MTLNVIINQAAPIVWEDKVVDKKVDALLEAIHKEGGLGLVTWVDHGTNIFQTEKNIEKNDGEQSEDKNEKSDSKETSRKRKTEVVIASTKKIKALDSSVSVSSTESTEVIRMKIELEQQAKKVETLECKLEEMGKQLKSYETMRLRIELLETEVMLLTEKSKTNEVMGVDQAKVAREKSTRLKKPGPALQTPLRCIIPNVGNKKQENELNVMRGRGYDPFAPVETQKVKILDDWLQLDEEYPIGSQNNGVEFFKVLRTPQDWLNEEILISLPGWTLSYDEFLKAQDLPIFPNGAHEYCSGKLPAFAGTGKKWMVDVDYIYSVLFVNKSHWVALFISIPNRCIEIFDCGLKGSSNGQIVKAVKPIAHMLPHLLRASAPSSERPKMSVEQYKVRRPRQGILKC
ncbi:hypothetical protein Bca52824_014225 [Brassica carinata]|uniref:Ubiquitin-like protease family profile domain-containing protein n=1 Tax=Brassica carinata TaxID=52824 RepID=A0A8X8B4L5_BRACI|nr:hypothetical protein Bca52824_014225 [Brassica carinata]